MKVVGIIPVMLESTRLHEKAIADICGLPLFVHTCKRAKFAETLDEVFLATDNELIAEIARIVQIAILTGTDVVDNLRLINVIENDGLLFLTDEYAQSQKNNIEDMLEHINILSKEINE